MNQTSDKKELAALDALIAASLAGRNIDDVSDEELLRRIDASPELKAEAAAILNDIGDSPFSRSLTSVTPTERVADEPAGMYRLGSDKDLDPALKAEIARKREEIRNRLKAARGR